MWSPYEWEPVFYYDGGKVRMVGVSRASFLVSLLLLLLLLLLLHFAIFCYISSTSEWSCDS